LIEHSHHDPVYEVYWVQSKSGTQAVSASTDGRLLFWDVRKFAMPTDQV
jgi:dynein intermediate chain 2